MSFLPSPDILAALLAFHRDSGVDICVDESPFNAFDASTAAPAPLQKIAPALPTSHERITERAVHPSTPPVDQRQELADTRATAASCTSLDELYAVLQRFDGCALKQTATHTVFEDGSREASLMLVGEAPGREEDLSGKPFVGPSGQLLERMLAAMGMKRQDVYIANVIPWRPPGNRTPTPQEIALCLPFIQRQIALKKPRLLVCLGGPAMQALLGARQGILKSRGTFMTCDTGDGIVPALATLHPAYVLRSPAAKRLLWRDMLTAKRFLQPKP